MDWSRYLHISWLDLRGLASRRMIILAVMAVFIYQGVGIFYKIITLQLIREIPLPAAEVKAPERASAPREPAEAYRTIAERNLFRTTTRAAEDKRGGIPRGQDVALLFDIRGTVAGEGDFGFAIIEEKSSRKQRLVKTGDVFAGAKFLRVIRNAVVVLYEGRERTLKIVETKREPIPSRPSTETASTESSSAPLGTFVIRRSELDDAMKNIGALLSQAQVRPHFSAGVPDGFIVTSIRPGSLYQRMGINVGDIIQEVNQRKIKTADDVMGLLNTIKSGDSLSLGIKRRGKPETLSYQFQ